MPSYCIALVDFKTGKVVNPYPKMDEDKSYKFVFAIMENSSRIALCPDRVCATTVIEAFQNSEKTSKLETKIAEFEVKISDLEAKLQEESEGACLARLFDIPS